mmetsp:Transcript_7367/g.17525  ORF Transcript_7367/g.17525 Transcript_7367/m.17525 type:complete len:211 (+) Transcript_7367:703-1335(+)
MNKAKCNRSCCQGFTGSWRALNHSKSPRQCSSNGSELGLIELWKLCRPIGLHKVQGLLGKLRRIGQRRSGQLAAKITNVTGLLHGISPFLFMPIRRHDGIAKHLVHLNVHLILFGIVVVVILLWWLLRPLGQGCDLSQCRHHPFVGYVAEVPIHPQAHAAIAPSRRTDVVGGWSERRLERSTGDGHVDVGRSGVEDSAFDRGGTLPGGEG